MTTKVSEAGRKISTANAAKIKAAIEALAALISDDSSEVKEASGLFPYVKPILPDTKTGDDSKASVTSETPLGTVETRDQIKAGLQALIDILSPDSKENVEGDGDGDADTDNALFQGHIGDVIVKDMESIREATLNAAKRKSLSDDKFGYIEPGAGDDVSKKHFPIHDAAHVRNALARIAQGAKFGDEALPKVKAAAKRMGVDVKDSKESALIALHRIVTDKNGVVRESISDDNISEAMKKQTGMVCAACGEPVSSTWDSYCSNCGSSLKSAPKGGYCQGCGSSLDSEDKFCPSCGRAVTLKEAAKAGDAGDDDGDSDNNVDDSHMDAFGNMTAMKQMSHLVGKHGKSPGGEGLDTATGRKAAHDSAHKTKESALEPVELEWNFLPLVEKALKPDGTLEVKMIQPGWGSSGYYHSNVLARDAAEVFPKGTKMFWDHPTLREEKERPERSLRDIAAVTISDAYYNPKGKEGAGIYATAKPLESYKDDIEQLAPFIGASIHTGGLGRKGEAEGKKGVIIEKLLRTPTTSCDFVTAAGAGGMILSEAGGRTVLELFESAGRHSRQPEETDDVTEQEVKDLQRKLREAEGRNAQLQEKILLRETRDYAEEELSKIEGLPAMTIKRIAEAVTFEPPTDEDGELDKKALRAKIKERVKSESEYLESVLRSGRPRGMGSAPGEDSDDDSSFLTLQAREGEIAVGGLSMNRAIEADFLRLGLNENIAKQAAKGR